MNALLAALIAVGGAVAPVQDGRLLRTAGDFDVAQFDDSCEIQTFYDFAGRSQVFLFMVRDEDGYGIGVTSADWSNREGETYNLQFHFDQRVFEADALGMRNIWGKGFQVRISADAFGAFRGASSLLITSGSTPITHLSLAGSSAAVTALDSCWAPVARRLAAERREVERFSYIPRDPFAAAGESSAPAVAPSVVRPPVISNPSWARQPQPTYPDRALERGLSGSADLSCTVNPNGSVSGCIIVSERPAGAGFGRAAMAAARSARLSPRSVDGVASGGVVRFTVPFNLPD